MKSVIPPVTYEISPDFSCIKCGAATPTNAENCTSCGEASLILDIGEFFKHVFLREIVDVRQGGLVLGRESSEDDIPIFDFRAMNVAGLCGMMQGMEFIMSTEATAKHYDQLVTINSVKGDASILDDIMIPLTGNVFDTNQFSPLSGLHHNAGVWIERQFIINRYATKKHIEELIQLNSFIAT